MSKNKPKFIQVNAIHIRSGLRSGDACHDCKKKCYCDNYDHPDKRILEDCIFDNCRNIC